MGLKTTEEIKVKLDTIGAKYALSRRHRHPTVSKNIINKKGTKEIFDLDKTSDQLKKAVEFLSKIVDEEHQILFTTTRKESENLLKEVAESISMPFVISRWIGGTLTNPTNIKKRVEHYQKLKKEKSDSSWEEKYTKKECVLFQRELNKLDARFGGLEKMTEMPRALFVIDPQKEKIAVNEANIMKIPVVAVGNSDTDLSKITYPIMVNCNSTKTVKYILEMISKTKKK